MKFDNFSISAIFFIFKFKSCNLKNSLTAEISYIMLQTMLRVSYIMLLTMLLISYIMLPAMLRISKYM